MMNNTEKPAVLPDISDTGVKTAKKSISPAVIRRLPRYYRYLGELLKNGITRISSRELSERMSVTASQIRQDLNCFGGFGKYGYGYDVALLHEAIAEILGIKNAYSAVIIGAGKLGNALANHSLFSKSGVKVIALFDVNPEIIGRSVAGVDVLPMDSLESFCRGKKINLAVLTLPKSETQAAAVRLAKLGIYGFWNFANMELALPDYPDVRIENVHIGDSLMRLCYAMANGEKGEIIEN
ncbi:MAG: redox-sensing transcriptional repressor Rex [Oscillospiraceae bacterium]|nr:redox-sensing transcriptional repressor Rex [Oscillospiraceae bacterium]